MNIKYWYFLTFFWAVIFTASIAHTIPDPTWQQEEVVENVDQRFMDLEIADSKLNIVYRNTSDRGVMVTTKEIGTGLKGSAIGLIEPSSWTEPVIVDDQPGSGSYLSAAEIGDELMVAYQDSSVGSEKVVIASENDTGWSTETVENTGEGGVNVGMYTSLTSYQDRPMVLYHSPNQGLKAATKQGNEWQKQRIADDMGWFTATTSCGEKVVAAYRGRNSEQLRISSFDGGWNTEETNSQVKSDISLDEQNCEPHILYLAASEQIKYRNQGTEQKLADSAYSRHSIDTTEDKIHATYYNYGEGIFYAQKQNDQGWNKTKLTNHSNTDEYNEIAVDRSGNIHLVFAQNSDIIHAEKNTGTVGNLREIQNYTRILFGTILIGLIANLGRKPELQQQIIQSISKLK